jgi:phosphoribosylformylglycinamidine synthase PurS subunit
VTRYHCSVDVRLKPGLLDPQGKAVEGSLPTMGWTNVSDVKVGKHIEFDLEAADEAAAVEQISDISERLLSNPVIETFVIRDLSEHDGVTREDGP